MSFIDKIMDALSLYDEEEVFEEDIQEVKPKRKAKEEKEEGKKKRFSFLKPKAEEKEEEPAAPSKPEPFKPALIKAEPAFKPEPKPEAKPVRKFDVKSKEVKPAKKVASFFSRNSDTDENGNKVRSLPMENRMVNMVLLEPVSFDDSVKIADYLRTSQPVVVNFENTDSVVAKRMTDYISGTIYALGGSMKKLNRSILICAPKNVDIDAGINITTEGELRR